MPGPAAGQRVREGCTPTIYFLQPREWRPSRVQEIGLSFASRGCLNPRSFNTMSRFSQLVSILLVLALFGGCAGNEDPTKNWSPEKLYNEAKTKVDEADYETAIKYFEILESRYAYGRYAEQAQLEIAYANYKYDEPALALAAADRFIRLHPTHPNVDYAYYLKGLVNFHGEKSVANWLFGAKDDLSDRDPKGALESYSALREVVERFPNSRS